MVVCKGDRLKRAGKYVLGYVFSLLLLVTVAGAGNAAAPDESARESSTREVAPGDNRPVQPYGKNVYKPTPAGERSEAWGDDRYGPDHLRRISPTEHLPASPQVERVIPLN